MGLDLDYQEGQTPLDDDEMEGLRIETISTKQELNEFEQQNIEKALEWTMKRSFKYETILTEDFIQKLHKRMYGDVWTWASEFRRTNKNIGIDKWQIPTQLKAFKRPVFTWGAVNLEKERDIRTIYLAAIRATDYNNIEPLIKFARS